MDNESAGIMGKNQCMQIAIYMTYLFLADVKKVTCKF